MRHFFTVLFLSLFFLAFSEKAKAQAFPDNEYGPYDTIITQAIFYDGEGNRLVKGEYKKNKKSGIWETYENGKLIKTETAAQFSGKTFKLDNPNELEYKEELKEGKK